MHQFANRSKDSTLPETGDIGLVYCERGRAAEIEGFADPTAAWLLLIEDFPTLSRWRNAIRISSGVLDAADLTDHAAESMRGPFLKEMAALGRRHNVAEWWCSRTGERNTLASPLFRNLCFLDVVRRAAESHPNLLVVCDDRSVLDQLDSSTAFPTYWLSAPRQKKNSRWGNQVLGVAAFLLSNAIQRWQAPPAPEEPVDVIIHTHVEPSALDKDEFSDRLMPGLESALRRHGLRAFTMPYLHSIRRSRGLWETMKRSGYNPFCEKRYYRPSDYLRAIHLAYKSSRMTVDPSPIGGIEVDVLFEAERKRTRYDAGTLESLLRTFLARRLCENDLRPSGLIMEFENMILERGLIIGFREDLPETSIVGYQHSAVAPMLLCNFVQASEVGTAPIPDKVICNGPLFREVLIAEGLPEDVAVAGGALRFQHLHNRVTHPAASPNDGSKSFLVPLPLMESDAAELLTKVIGAFGTEEQTKIVLKAHPFGSMDLLLQACGLAELPDNFEITEEPLAFWLPNVSGVIGLSSSALVEAAASGVDVITVRRDVGIELDQLAWTPQLRTEARTPEEILRATRDLSHLGSNKSERQAASSRHRDRLFAPVSEKTYLEFAPPALVAHDQDTG